MSRYRRWVNPGGPLVFFTTSTVGFARVFERAEIRDLVAASLLDDHRFYGAKLHAFCVMPHHLHFVSWMPDERSASWFMNRVKSNAAKRLLPRLTIRERAALEQLGATGRVLWQRSYRGKGLDSGRGFFACVRYVHLNPVRAGLCHACPGYRWSSSRLWEEGLWDPELGLPVTDERIRQFADPRLLEFA